MKKVIIFDMDGVIIDSIGPAMEFYRISYPSVTDEMYRELHSGNYHEETQKHFHLKKEETEEERKIRHQKYAEMKSKVPMFDGIKELLENLHKLGYILILNTNAYNRNCLPILENHKINNLFDFIATAELSKSKVEKFEIIEKKYKTNNKNTLFITDALGDVKEASAAGVLTVAVTWGVHDKSFFERKAYFNLVGVVNTVDELSDFIKRRL